MCVWQLDGVVQWCMIDVQLSAEAGSAPSCVSVAWPEKLIMSPTFQVRLDDGVSITALGAVLPTVIVFDAVSVAPRLSVTRSAAWYTPEVM